MLKSDPPRDRDGSELPTPGVNLPPDCDCAGAVNPNGGHEPWCASLPAGDQHPVAEPPPVGR
jgi:hypothetical protein